MVITFLAGIVFVIFLRTVKKDLTLYEELDKEAQAQMNKELSVWKLVVANVIRSPSNPALECVMVGNGIQILGMAVASCDNHVCCQFGGGKWEGFSSVAVPAEKMSIKGSATKFCDHFAEIFADCNKHKELSCDRYNHLLVKCGSIGNRSLNSDGPEDKSEDVAAVERIASNKGKNDEDMPIPFGLILMANSGCEEMERNGSRYTGREVRIEEKCNKRYAAILEKIVG